MTLTILDPRSGDKVTIYVENVPAVRQASCRQGCHPSALPSASLIPQRRLSPCDKTIRTNVGS